MKVRPVAKILIDSSGALFVCPQAEEHVGYEYIYREASGLRWNEKHQALCAYEPSRWEHEELLRHVAATLREAYDEELICTEGTIWVGVPPELEGRLRSALARSG